MRIDRQWHRTRSARLLGAAGVIASALTLGSCDEEPSSVARAQALEAPAGKPAPDDPPAAPPVLAAQGVADALPAPEAEAEAPPVTAPTGPGFLGLDETGIRRSLAHADFASATKGRGGRSLGFKVTLEDGTVGYFKPEQTFSAAHWFSEVAAYYLDRELGLGRVPPVVGRRMAWAPLRAVAGGDARVPEVLPGPDGAVRGAFVYWVPEGLDPLPLGKDWEVWVRLEGPMGRSPYLRPAEVRARVASETQRPAGEPDRPERAAELSDLILFDYLIQNVDRWGGDNTNVRTRGRGGPLVFFDNGAGFWPNTRVPLMEARLRPLQRFRRSTIDALRRFDIDRFRARLAEDALAPVLTEVQLSQLAERRQTVLEHVEALERRFGAAIWL